MIARKTGLIFAAGLAAGLAIANAFFGLGSMPRASAQGSQATTPRFSISSWGYGAAPGYGPAHGAYILDTTSGKIWAVEGNQKPSPIGEVK